MTTPLTREQVEEQSRSVNYEGNGNEIIATAMNQWQYTDAALRAQVEKYQRDKQIGDALMLEGSQKIDELRDQLAQVTAERDNYKNTYEDLRDHFTAGSLRGQIQSLQHQLAEVERQRDAHADVASERRRELQEAQARIKDLTQPQLRTYTHDIVVE